MGENKGGFFFFNELLVNFCFLIGRDDADAYEHNMGDNKDDYFYGMLENFSFFIGRVLLLIILFSLIDESQICYRCP